MGKLGVAGTSLIAAVPSGFLAYLLVLAVLNQQAMNAMPMPFKVTLFSLLAICSLLVLFPLYLLIWFRGAHQGGGSRRSALGNVAVAGDADLSMDEDLVESEFVDDEGVGAEDWADSGEVGEVTDSMNLDEMEDVVGASEDSETEYEMDGDLSSLGAEDFEEGDKTLEFTATAEDDLFGIGEDDSETGEFTPAGDLDDDFSFEDFDLGDEDEGKKK